MLPRTAPTREQMSAVILAGGRGQRMGGADKGLLLLQDKPLVVHVHDRLRPQLATIVVSANRNLERYRELIPAGTASDRWPDYRGPLAGIETGFRATTTDWLLAIPADMPGLPADLVDQLASGIGNAAAAYAVIDGDACYPLCLLHRTLHDDLGASIEQGDYAVHRWLSRQQAVAVAVRGWAEGLRNLNTPEALAAASRPRDLRQDC